MTPEYLADRELWPDEHSVEGEPVCCDKAINEFRAERGIPAFSAPVLDAADVAALDAAAEKAGDAR
jgi:hypothetical protein